MEFSKLLTFLAITACFVSSCNGDRYKSCSAPLKPDVLKAIDKVLVSERFVFAQDFMKFCRSYETERWLNMTEDVVCFGGRGHEFAPLVIPMEGFLMSLKLVHVTGHVTCGNSAARYKSKWGCSRRHPIHGKTPFNVVITTGQNNGILYPKELFPKYSKKSLWYDMPEVEPDSPELIFGDSSSLHYVTSGQVLRVWYGEDLLKSGEKDNAGKVCITAQGWYMH